MPKGHRLAAVVITWNSASVIRRCLESLDRQRFRDFSLLVIDNRSVDDTLALVSEADRPVSVITNPRNLGYARAANQGIAVTRAPYVAILNPDVEAEAGALGAAVAALDAHPEVGALAPWLFRMSDNLNEPVPRGTVDSSGLAVTRGRRLVDRDAGRATVARSAGPVFGATGAFAVFRREALEAIRSNREFFDEDFFAYKEDADLAWRLQLAGWTAWFEPAVRALHRRGIGASDSWLPDVSAHRHRPLALARLAYRNHLAMLLKNDTFRAALPDLPWIAVEEAGKFAYYLIRRPRVLPAVLGLIRSAGSRAAKRRLTLKRARLDPRTLRDRWFNHR